MNTIVCLEPWSGGAISKRDTGFGNRVIDWAILYYISTLLEDCELLVQEEYWPELEFLSLPKTKVTTMSSDEVKKKFSKLTPSHISNILNSKDVSSIQNSKYIGWYSAEWIVSDGVYESILSILSSGIKDIKFKDENVNRFFKDRFSDFFSIHLRRGFGTTPTLGFFKEYLSYNKEIFKSYLKDYYFNSINLGYESNHYLIIPDTVYFSIIEDIISKNKDHKIYISSDISEDYYSHYFEKYPDNIVSKNQYIDEFLNLFEYDETKVKTYRYSLKQTLINLFDMFVLAHSKTLILCGTSTWGQVAFLIGEEKTKIEAIPYILVKDGISFNKFVVKYKFVPCKSIIKQRMSYLEPVDEHKNPELSLLDLVGDWYFPDNSKEDCINLMNQVNCWLSLQKKSQVDDEYSLGWNECIENIKTKLM
jgi:hypothetical protein